MRKVGTLYHHCFAEAEEYILKSSRLGSTKTRTSRVTMSVTRTVPIVPHVPKDGGHVLCVECTR